MSRLYFAVDTSNYTTSAAVYDAEHNAVYHAKRLLPVRKGEKGIRQSEAVFHHTQQLPEMTAKALNRAEEGLHAVPGSLRFSAFGASARPRRKADSYMPCFLVGTCSAGNSAAVAGVPFYAFSHQEGHVAAALYSSGRLDLVGKDFLAFHVSGGTTESLLVHPGEKVPLQIECIGTSTDLKAGMAIDRVGLMLGLSFPAGPALEQLALQSEKEFRIHPSVRGMDCSLSGVENKCRAMLEKGEPPADIARFCLRYIEASLRFMATRLMAAYPGLPIVFSGGVMSNSLIRRDFTEEFGASFASPEFSADNAAGTAVLTALSAEAGLPPADPAAICAARK